MQTRGAGQFLVTDQLEHHSHSRRGLPSQTVGCCTSGDLQASKGLMVMLLAAFLLLQGMLML